jgi:diketogulonate reductase-like aldo/keto reductase
MMPHQGTGTYQLRTQEAIDIALSCAFSNAALHNIDKIVIDTAEIYKNQHLIGNFLKKNNISRDKYWLTSKISFHTMRKPAVDIIKSINKSFEDLGVEYIDLYLLHACVENNIIPWDILKNFKSRGKILNIGISNFNVQNFNKFCEQVTPSDIYCSQLEINPFLFRKDLIKLCFEKSVKVTAYGSLYKTSQIITDIASKYKKSEQQILIKWALQNNLHVIPRSSNPSHIKDNFDMKFIIEKEDMLVLDSMHDGSSKFERYL